MKLTQQQKQTIWQMTSDYLKSSIHADKLFGDPIKITITGAPVDTIVYHREDESVICLAKRSPVFNYRPTTNIWNAFLFILKAIEDEKTIEHIEVTWDAIYSLRVALLDQEE